MIQEHEIYSMLIGLGVLLCTFLGTGRVRRIPFSNTLRISFLFLCAGYVLAVAEGLLPYSYLNPLKHACYAVSAVLAALWCSRIHLGDGTRG